MGNAMETENKLEVGIISNDENLFKIFDEKSETECFLSFLSEETRAYLKASIGNIAENLNDTSELQHLWKSLIIDSIHFLKINDSRERAFYKKDRSAGHSDNKSKMGDDDVDLSAKRNVYGIEELSKYFEKFSSFEELLYGSDRYYRDHLKHPIRVWAIGMSILKTYGNIFNVQASGKHFKINESINVTEDWIDEKKGEHQIAKGELFAMWTIIALTHDLGYPLEKVDRINDRLEDMLREFGKIGFARSGFTFQSQHDHLVRFLLNVVSSNVQKLDNNKKSKEVEWCTHTRPKYLTKFSKSWEMFDHGIVSSLILLKSLTYFFETDISTDNIKGLSVEDAKQFAIRSEILHAIAAHTTPKVYHLAAKNLPFLLVLCDELQEWDRPTLKDLKKMALTDSDCKDTDENVKVCLEKFDLGNTNECPCEIHCVFQLPDASYARQEAYSIRRLKIWNELLRPAVFDKDRAMIFKWEIKFGSLNQGWVFSIDTTKDPFEQVKVYGPKKKNLRQKEDKDLYD